MLLKFGGFVVCLAVLLSRVDGGVAWHYDELDTGYSGFDSVRLFYLPQDVTTDLGIQLVCGDSGLWGYLYVSQREVPLAGTGEDESLVSYVIGDEAKEFSSKRMKGGHCLLLPEDVVHAMIAAWQSGLSVQVATDGGFHTLIQPSGFSKAFARIKEFELKKQNMIPSAKNAYFSPMN